MLLSGSSNRVKARPRSGLPCAQLPRPCPSLLPALAAIYHFQLISSTKTAMPPRVNILMAPAIRAASTSLPVLRPSSSTTALSRRAFFNIPNLLGGSGGSGGSDGEEEIYTEEKILP